MRLILESGIELDGASGLNASTSYLFLSRASKDEASDDAQLSLQISRSTTARPIEAKRTGILQAATGASSTQAFV
jgi:hypothetical protein